MKVRLPTLNLFYYPDIAVTCDARDLRSDEDFILYPKLIVEVLSDSTEAFDRGDKFADYKSNLVLEEYVLIHQKQILVERFQRKTDSLWLPHIYQAGDRVEFDSINRAAISQSSTKASISCKTRSPKSVVVPCGSAQETLPDHQPSAADKLQMLV